jgi:hypothetical protein
MHLRFLAILVVLTAPAPAFAVSLSGQEPAPLNHNYAEPVEWRELQAEPPAAPRNEDLIEFYVGPNTTNRFYIDGTTLSAGKDGVVRYVLVVKAAGGATNVTFEGIRCQTGEYRLYASGRADGTWALSRTASWRPIENKPINRHHAALSRDLFCQSGIPIANPDQGRDALRRSKDPRAP